MNILRNLFFLLLIAFRQTYGQGMNLVKCDSSHHHPENIYIEDSITRMRIYFYTEREGQLMLRLLDSGIISIPLLFQLHGMDSQEVRSALPYCDTDRIFYPRGDIIVVKSINICAKRTRWRNKYYELVINTAIEIGGNSGVCIPLKRKSKISQIEKANIAGAAVLCIFDI